MDMPIACVFWQITSSVRADRVGVVCLFPSTSCVLARVHPIKDEGPLNSVGGETYLVWCVHQSVLSRLYSLLYVLDWWSVICWWFGEKQPAFSFSFFATLAVPPWFPRFYCMHRIGHGWVIVWFCSREDLHFWSEVGHQGQQSKWIMCVRIWWRRPPCDYTKLVCPTKVLV